MAKRLKTNIFSFQGFDNAHYKTTAAYTRAVNELFDKATSDIAEAANKEDYNPDKPFSFDDYPRAKARLQTTLKGLAKKMQAVVETGSRRQWLFACKKNEEFISSIFDTTKLTKGRLKKMQDRNLDALQAFQQRKVGGMDLSERVWKYTEQYKEQIEIGLDVGLGEGRSAQQLSRDLRQNLKDPDRLFRRVRDKRGNLQLSKAAKAFHPGRGVYRSSYKNAMRLTRSEINMAYRESDHLRWQQLDFIVGFEVHRSNREPQFKCKLCDRLVGCYPKWFKYKGFHPQCMCYATPILMDEEDFDNQELSDLKSALKGTEYKKYSAKNAVTDLPEEFKKWVEENAPQQRYWKSTPYFIKDNFVDGDLTKGLRYIPNVKPLTLLEKAAIRHEKRTPEQVQAIQKRWQERKQKHALIKQEAQGVLDTAKDYNEVDFSALQNAIDSGDIGKMQSITREVEKVVLEMQKQEEMLASIIPDVHEWHKQFTISELQGVYKAIEDKLASWEGLTLEKQLSKLKFEVSYVEDPSAFKPGAKKHSTWAVAQAAYLKKVNAVEYKLAVESISNDLPAIEGYISQYPKTKKLKGLLDDVKKAISSESGIDVIKSKMASAQTEYEKKVAEQAKKEAKSGQIMLAELSSEERKVLIDEYKVNKVEKVDALLRPTTEAIWKTLSEEERIVLTKYTQTYSYLNEPLRGIPYYGGRPKSEYDKDLPLLTSALNKFKTSKPMVVRRGTSSYFIPELGKDLIQVKPGDVFTDGGFLSTACHRDKGFGGVVNMVIFVPKGARGAFAEPFSHYTDNYKFDFNSKSLWDGNSKESINSEFEWIGQRGSKFRVISVEGGTIYLQLIGQLQ